MSMPRKCWSMCDPCWSSCCSWKPPTSRRCTPIRRRRKSPPCATKSRTAACSRTEGRGARDHPMLLTPTELERLTIYTAAELARKRRAKGLKLNHPEATAIIADEILEGAREGRSVADLIGYGSTLLTSDDVMPGVAGLMPMLQVEATFPDGTKLVTVHDPIRPGRQPGDRDAIVAGEIIAADGDIEIR